MKRENLFKEVKMEKTVLFVLFKEEEKELVWHKEEGEEEEEIPEIDEIEERLKKLGFKVKKLFGVNEAKLTKAMKKLKPTVVVLEMGGSTDEAKKYGQMVDKEKLIYVSVGWSKELISGLFAKEISEGTVLTDPNDDELIKAIIEVEIEEKSAKKKKLKKKPKKTETMTELLRKILASDPDKPEEIEKILDGMTSKTMEKVRKLLSKRFPEEIRKKSQVVDFVIQMIDASLPK